MKVDAVNEIRGCVFLDNSYIFKAESRQGCLIRLI